jgi:hypothetical protein
MTDNALSLRALHLLARLALRLCPPLHAKALVDRIGAHLAPLHGPEAARAAVRELSPAGTCLSRAVTIAARVRGADVVIGFDAWNGARGSAHAWLEIEGVRVDTSLDGNPQFPDELTRLPAVKV